MINDLNQLSLRLHKKLQGKLRVESKIRLNHRKALSLVYTPGVAEAVKHISDNPKSVFDLTIKHTTVAVVSDGSAVLGLGNVGPEAALPVMEGKCAIFKEFAGIDAFPICLATQEVNEIVATIKNISPVFGAINLEDISAPRCFEIEEKLQKMLDIPVMHDDQHATAIVVLAGLLNAAKIVDTQLIKCKVVIVGSGAAGCAIAKLLFDFGIKNIIMVDREGILSKKRSGLIRYKKKLLTITNPSDISGDLVNAARKSDVLIGVSSKKVFNKKIISVMNPHPIVFALANPDPEISPSDAKRWGVAIYANGRSDYSNQINNALVFPGLFRGLLKNRSRSITNEIKIRAAFALAKVIKNPSTKKFIPSIFDKRVAASVANSIEIS